MALLYTLTNLARSNELVATGISLARISVPFFAVALFIGGTLFAVTEFVAPMPRRNPRGCSNRAAPMRINGSLIWISVMTRWGSFGISKGIA